MIRVTLDILTDSSGLVVNCYSWATTNGHLHQTVQVANRIEVIEGVAKIYPAGEKEKREAEDFRKELEKTLQNDV